MLVPPQDLSSGELKLTLLPGVIRAIRFADGVEGSWRSAFPARPGELLNLRALEQGLEQMKRLASRDVDMDIVPGEAAGESDIVIRMRTSRSWRLLGNLDNSGAAATGRLQTGLTLALDDPLGLNDAFSASLSTDNDGRGAERGTGGAGLQYALPWGWWNFSLAAGSARYHQRVAGYNQSFLSSGRSRNLDLTVQRLFQRDQWQKNSLQLRLNRRWSRAYIDDTEILVQRRHTGYAELGWLHQSCLGRAQFNFTLANRWGVSWFGSQADAPEREPDGQNAERGKTASSACRPGPCRVAGVAGRRRRFHACANRRRSCRSRLTPALGRSHGQRPAAGAHRRAQRSRRLAQPVQPVQHRSRRRGAEQCDPYHADATGRLHRRQSGSRQRADAHHPQRSHRHGATATPSAPASGAISR
ncbi:ShlB/FhaC/HecB family hemolysin secretion/activation protein [Noviherbaspirillum sp. DKR-6]|uniref:ShlB/FhaC/HecB family hemolysin secretion/activation protein n=1 Tax=Noviherbaspirillum pedocola TaxID=2801341 RepID=A0A934SXR9_9BURK|nr:ShlB/FhaC/HecB family hemolysin secretion/activation protein [Noviherbaspirillum pedocola]MBK4737692.1 ShlB/FhaC/HecB family hemolysin secretion/activation protein [Noviherbaspirillum pedocola]